MSKRELHCRRNTLSLANYSGDSSAPATHTHTQVFAQAPSNGGYSAVRRQRGHREQRQQSPPGGGQRRRRHAAPLALLSPSRAGTASCCAVVAWWRQGGQPAGRQRNSGSPRARRPLAAGGRCHGPTGSGGSGRFGAPSEGGTDQRRRRCRGSAEPLTCCLALERAAHSR